MFNAFEIYVMARMAHETALKSNVSDDVVYALEKARTEALRASKDRFPELTELYLKLS